VTITPLAATFILDGSDVSKTSLRTWMAQVETDVAAGGGLPSRELLTANRTYYVRTDGSNSNDGLANTAGGAFLTLQKAVDTVAALDRGTFTVTISIGAGTFAGATLKWGPGSASILITGAGMASTTLNSLTDTQGPADYTISALKFEVTTVWLIGLWCKAGSLIKFHTVDFGSCPNYHVYAEYGAEVRQTSNITISAGATYHIYLIGSGTNFIAAGLTMTITGTPAFSVFINLENGCHARYNANTFSGSATGVRYSVSGNSVLFTGGGGATYIPGNSSGSTASGGQYT